MIFHWEYSKWESEIPKHCCEYISGVPVCSNNTMVIRMNVEFPVIEETYKSAITFPLFPQMTDENVELVISSVKKTLEI